MTNTLPEVQAKHFTTWMEEGRKKGTPYITAALELNNGVVLSIQASEFHYAAPRIDQPYALYTNFEVGYPSETIEELLQYGDPDEDIYAYVPLEVIDLIIGKACGIKGYKSCSQFNNKSTEVITQLDHRLKQLSPLPENRKELK